MIHGPGNKGNLNLLYKVVSKSLIEVICETMGRKAQIWYLPQKLMNGR